MNYPAELKYSKDHEWVRFEGDTAFIGISKAVIKAHGASNAEAIENAVGQAAAFARSGLIEKIEENVNLMKIEQ